MRRAVATAAGGAASADTDEDSPDCPHPSAATTNTTTEIEGTTPNKIDDLLCMRTVTRFKPPPTLTKLFKTY
jgi:hypothetical protein